MQLDAVEHERTAWEQQRRASQSTVTLLTHEKARLLGNLAKAEREVNTCLAACCLLCILIGAA